jgi:uncharacterized membrane protein YgcG
MLLFVTTIHAREYSNVGYVNDFANLLTPEQKVSLSEELATLEKKTTVEVIVVTVPSLGNQSIEGYAKGWIVGKRDKNNSIIFLFALKERKMRIESKLDARLVFTDSHANRIRDDVIIPHFKAGNVSQGIIDGTHAIMRAIDANFVPVTPAKEGGNHQVPQQTVWRTWASGDTKVLSYVLCSVAGVLVMLLIAVPQIRRSKARTYVLERKEAVSTKFAEADRIARSCDVKKETRDKLMRLKNEFSSITWLNSTSEGVKWVAVRRKLDFLDYPLGRIVAQMKQEIGFAEKAKKEGPNMLKEIPRMIESVERKLAEGNPSQQAMQYLEEARAQYAQVQRQQQLGIFMVDWVPLYLILVSIQSSVVNAESAHWHTNSTHSDCSPRLNDPITFCSFISGGGSTGSW